MGRLTKAEWDLINSALALYEAAVVDLDLSEREQERLAKRIAKLRLKVWDRLAMT